MTNRTHTGWLLLVFSRIYALAVAASLLAVCGVAAGCGEATPTAPSAAVVTNPAPTNPANISISGVVYDTAHRPLRGARVEVMEGTVGDWCHDVQPAPVCVVAAFTDGSGRFTFSGPFRSVTRLHASMERYLSATLTVDSTTSNSAIEFHLEPSVAP